MWLDNKKIRAAQHCDTVAHPERREEKFNRIGQFTVQYLKGNDYSLPYVFPEPMSHKDS